MKRFLRENGLSLFFALLFLSALIAPSFAGQQNYNAEQAEHGASTVSWGRYVTTTDF